MNQFITRRQIMEAINGIDLSTAKSVICALVNVIASQNDINPVELAMDVLETAACTKAAFQ